MYEVVPPAKVGESVTLENESADKSALEDNASRVITIEYVLVVDPSSAVTFTSTVFAPTAKETDDVPDTRAVNAPAVPSRYSIDAFASDLVPVIVTDDAVYGTVDVYEVVPLAKVGESAPLENDNADKSAFVAALERVITVE